MNEKYILWLKDSFQVWTDYPALIRYLDRQQPEIFRVEPVPKEQGIMFIPGR